MHRSTHLEASLKTTRRYILSLILCLTLLLAFCAGFAHTGAYADNDSVAQEPAITEPGEGSWQKTAKGWQYLTSNGAVSGFAKIDGKTYFLDPDTAIMATGWVKQQDTWYYFNRSGAMVTGWAKVKSKWYYLDPANGKMLTGKHTIGNATYFLTSSGAMKTGWNKEDDIWYYYKGSGAMMTGWLKSGGKWYYLDPADGKMLTGKHTIGNTTYFLTSSGAMKTGWNKEDGTWYHYKSSGAMTTGWLKSSGKWYYLDPADGKMLTGKYQVKDAWYVSNDSGAMYANKWTQQPEGWYYATKSGALQSGWLKSGGKWYYLQPDQDCLMFADGKKTIDGALYSFTSSGAMQANCQVRLDNGDCGYAASSGAITTIGTFSGDKVILKNANGEILTGWQKLAGKWFYGDEGGVAHTGWLKDNGKWYWLGSDGAMVTNAWVDGGKYYVGANGVWVQANIIQDIRSQFSHGTKTAKYQKYIVIHDTEGGGTPENVISGWASNGKLVAAHFVIGKDGRIVQCVPLDQIAHHAGWGTAGHNAKFGVTDESRDDKRGTVGNSWSNDYGMNSYSVGIELVHNGSTGEAYPEAQLKALDQLIAYIDSYYGFKSTIIDHKMWRIGNSDTSKEFARYLANYRDHRTHN